MADSARATTSARGPAPAADPKARRRPAVLALLVVLGAAAAAGAAATTWWTQVFVDSLTGSVTTRATGSRADPLLIPVALVALAGFGAALATTGAVRRGVGAVLALGGAGAALLAVVALFAAPDTLRSDLTRPAEAAGAPDVHAFGPVLGVLAGLLVAAAGVLLLAGFGARKGRRGLGSRYDAPTRRRSSKSRGGGPAGSGPPGADRTAPPGAGATRDPAADANAAASWWKALDAGQDPTAAGSGGSSAPDAAAGADEQGYSNDANGRSS